MDHPNNSKPTLKSKPQLQSIPDELKKFRQFVCWSYELRGGKQTKVPINPKTGGSASVDDSSTWGDCRTAVRSYKEIDDCEGIGFVLTEDDPFTFIDLDDIVDPETGDFAQWAVDLIIRFDSYTELSPSETGVHILVKGKLPPEGRRKGQIEMYDDNRYMTFSGLVVLDKSIKKKPKTLKKFHQEIFGKKKTSPSSKATPKPSLLSDKEIKKKASNAANSEKFNKLFGGDWSAYSSQSEADLALCYILSFYTQDRDQLDRLFRDSELYRPKWDQKRGGRTYGELTIDKALENVEESYTDDVWPELKELPQLRGEAPTLKPELIPPPIRHWLVDAANRLQVPLEFCAAPAIVAIGSLVGRNIGIYPKRRDDWIVIPNLWGACIGRPGLLKTPASDVAIRPLDRLIAGAREEHAQALAEQEADQEIHSAKMEALKANLKMATKNGNERGLKRIREELVELTSQASDLVTYEKRYRTNDATVEKLGELLNQNSRGLFYYRDELTGWMRNLDRSGREGDREFFLESWNGSGNFTVDRIGRGTLHVDALCLSLFGGIQPGKLERYVSETVEGGWGDDGLLQRFQLLVWPETPKDWKNIDQYPNQKARERAYAAFECLDQLDPTKLPGAKTTPFNEIPALHFSGKAQEVFDEWRSKLEIRLRSGDIDSPAFESHLAKYRSLMPTLALLFYLLQFVDGNAKGQAVTLSATKCAISWCEFLEAHARKVYAGALHPDLQAAHALARKITAGDVRDGDKVRSIYQHHWRLLNSLTQVESALAVLEEYGWGRSETLQTGGRPTDVIRLHPDLIGEDEWE